MTNEEAIEIIKELFPNCDDGSAAELAIKALENQSKYENALERAADYINDCDDCPVKECAGVTSGANTDECSKKIISAWKRKARFEVANNENE